MQFPFWIENTRKREVKAQLRLKYMLNRAALERYGRTSMHDLAAEVGCNHSSIFNAINRGYFTPQMADAIELVFGRDVLPAEYLISPMEVGKETK